MSRLRPKPYSSALKSAHPPQVCCIRSAVQSPSVIRRIVGCARGRRQCSTGVSPEVAFRTRPSHRSSNASSSGAQFPFKNVTSQKLHYYIKLYLMVSRQTFMPFQHSLPLFLSLPFVSLRRQSLPPFNIWSPFQVD